MAGRRLAVRLGIRVGRVIARRFPRRACIRICPINRSHFGKCAVVIGAASQHLRRGY